MNNLVDIRLELDEKCKDPKVTVRAKERTKLVDNIIQAVENVSEKHFPGIPAIMIAVTGVLWALLENLHGDEAPKLHTG